ncbi:STAS domain-containing protein [Acinetobacter baumannii]
MVQYLNQELVVSGKIDFENAEQQYQAGLAIIKKQTSFPLIVDLKQLEHGNTLALAVLVQWLRQTPQKSGLHFKNVPEKMLKCGMHIKTCYSLQLAQSSMG